MVKSMVQGRDSKIILNSSVPSREAMNLDLLRYTQNHSTPDKFRGENKFAVWDFFGYASFVLLEKERIMYL